MEVQDDLEIREAQLLLATLESKWADERNRSWALMRDLQQAEERLIEAFQREWRERGGERRMMNLAYSQYRKRLMQQFGLRESPLAASDR